MQAGDGRASVRKNCGVGLRAAVPACVFLVLLASFQSSAWGWGLAGHVLSGEAAARTMPATMPKFFRKATKQLAYLTAEPDRWRDPHAAAITAAFNPDHAINLERVPPGALDAKDRFAYLEILRKAGEDSSVGMAPF